MARSRPLQPGKAAAADPPKSDRTEASPACAPIQRRQLGVTYTELMLVVVLLGIVAAIALPKLNSSLDETHISGAAREVTAALEFAKTAAVSSYGQTRVTFDAAADTMIVERAKANDKLLGGSESLAESEVETVTFTPMQYPMKRGTDYMIDLPTERRFGGTEISAVDFGGKNFVIFDEFGTPSDGGTVTLALGTLRVTVTLDGQTGKFTRGVVTMIG